MGLRHYAPIWRIGMVVAVVDRHAILPSLAELPFVFFGALCGALLFQRLCRLFLVFLLLVHTFAHSGKASSNCRQKALSTSLIHKATVFAQRLRVHLPPANGFIRAIIRG
jgi:hypothetical protein